MSRARTSPNKPRCPARTLRRSARARRRPAFSLIELLVVVAVIGTLASLLTPALAHARDASRRVACAAKARSLAMTTALFAEERRAMPVAPERGAIGELDLAPDAWRCPEDRALDEAFAGSSFAYLGLTNPLGSVDLSRPRAVRADVAYRAFVLEPSMGLYKQATGRTHATIATFAGTVESHALARRR